MLINLLKIFPYTFIIKAFLVGVFLSIAMSLLGFNLVLKRYSMIGDGLSHVSFSAHTIAVALHWAPPFFSIFVVTILAIFLMQLSNNNKIKGDAVIAILSTSFLSIGIVVVSATTGINTNVLNYMFGNILAISNLDLILSLVFSFMVIGIFILCYNKFFIVAFDENFAKAVGVNTKIYSTITAILVSILIVVGMKIIGSLLISSLIVFPVLSAMKISKTFKLVAINSAFLAMFCFVVGLCFSCIYSTPTGATVVLVNLFTFLILNLIFQIFKKNKKRLV